jgi:hypothetical protein
MVAKAMLRCCERCSGRRGAVELIVQMVDELLFTGGSVGGRSERSHPGAGVADHAVHPLTTIAGIRCGGDIGPLVRSSESAIASSAADAEPSEAANPSPRSDHDAATAPTDRAPRRRSCAALFRYPDPSSAAPGRTAHALPPTPDPWPQPARLATCREVSPTPTHQHPPPRRITGRGPFRGLPWQRSSSTVRPSWRGNRRALAIPRQRANRTYYWLVLVGASCTSAWTSTATSESFPDDIPSGARSGGRHRDLSRRCQPDRSAIGQ